MSKKKSKYRSINELLQVIDIDKFKNYRYSHTRKQTEEFFDLAVVEYCKLANKLELFKSKDPLKKELEDISTDDFIKLLLKYSCKELAEMYHANLSFILNLEHKHNLVNKSYVDL